MHRRMGTLAVLLVFLLASFTVITDNSDAASPTPIPPEHIDNATYKFDATEVTAFTFPESRGIPVMNAISQATESVYISVYLFSSKDCIRLLSQMADKGVDVKVLIDGTPLGVTSNIEMLMQLDQTYGGDVRLINFKGATTPQFDYLHNKYCIIDGETVIVTSENWTQGNFSSSTGNRGWGTIIKSPAYASYLYNNIFQHDFEDDNDVNKIEDVYSPSIASTADIGTYALKSETNSKTFTGHIPVYPAHSPDTSFNIMKEYMAQATTRLYVEELDISPSYTDWTHDGPIKWMVEKAAGGVDVKYILDISYEKKDKPAHSQLIYDLNHQTNVKAAPIKGGTGFSITHNKGIIVDDMVWVGSVNMTPTSFHEDREMAVIIYSGDVADYYAGFFETDFNYDPEYKPGEYTALDRVVDEVEENPWYVAVIAVAIAAIGVFVKKVLLGGAKGGKKGAKKAAKTAGISAAKKIAKSASKEYAKSSKKKSGGSKKK